MIKKSPAIRRPEQLLKQLFAGKPLPPPKSGKQNFRSKAVADVAAAKVDKLIESGCQEALHIFGYIKQRRAGAESGHMMPSPIERLSANCESPEKFNRSYKIFMEENGEGYLGALNNELEERNMPLLSGAEFKALVYRQAVMLRKYWIDYWEKHQ